MYKSGINVNHDHGRCSVVTGHKIFDIKKHRRPVLKFIVAQLLASTAALSSPALAADITWNGATSDDWFTSGNWNGGTLPTSADTVLINNANPVLIDGQAVTVNSAHLADGADSASLSVSGANGSIVITAGANASRDAGPATTISVSDGAKFETVSNGLYLDGGNETTVTGAGSRMLIGTLHSGTPDIWSDADGWFSLSHGTTTVSDGATLEADGVYLQGGVSGDAVMTVTGPGTVMDAHLLIYIGGNGNGIVGDGALTISDGATVTASVFAAGTDSGDTGTLLLTGEGSSLSIVPHAGFLGNAYAGSSGNGLIVVQEGAELSVANQLRIAFSEETSGKLVIGAEEGQAAVAAGHVTATNGIVFGAGNGELVFNHTDTGLIFGSTISGDGTIKILSGTTVLTANSSGFLGDIQLISGHLQVDGSLGDAIMTVSDGARLSGSGTVGAVEAESGSTIAPGNSPGTLTVAGNYQQHSGAVYEAELVPSSSTSDKVVVTGTAQLDDGAVIDVVKYGADPYSIDAHYIVFSAAGGVDGVFSVTGDTRVSAFYSLQARYTADEVHLEAVQSRAFVDAAVSQNQQSVAGGIESLETENALRFAFGSLQTDAEARAAFDSLSGEIYSSIKRGAMEDSRFLRNATIDRVRAAFGGVNASSGSVRAYAGEAGGTAQKVAATTDGAAFWGQGYGDWGHFDSNGNAARTTRNVGGFVMGGDFAASTNLRLGVVGGYSRSNYKVRGLESSASIDTYSVGLYGGSAWDSVGLRFGAAHAWSKGDVSRTVSFGDFSEALSANYKAQTTQLFTDLGYRIDAGSVSLEPFAALAYVNVHSNGFTEAGGLAALSAQGEREDVTFSSLGLRATGELKAGALTLAPYGTLAWRHAWGTTVSETLLSFDGSDAFSVAGVPLARNSALIEAGLLAPLSSHVSLGLSYAGQFGDGQRSQGIKGNLTVKF